MPAQCPLGSKLSRSSEPRLPKTGQLCLLFPTRPCREVGREDSGDT